MLSSCRAVWCRRRWWIGRCGLVRSARNCGSSALDCLSDTVYSLAHRASSLSQRLSSLPGNISSGAATAAIEHAEPENSVRSIHDSLLQVVTCSKRRLQCLAKLVFGGFTDTVKCLGRFLRTEDVRHLLHTKQRHGPRIT